MILPDGMTHAKPIPMFIHVFALYQNYAQFGGKRIPFMMMVKYNTYHRFYLVLKFCEAFLWFILVIYLKEIGLSLRKVP